MTLLLPINIALYVLSAVLLWRSLARQTAESRLLLFVPLAAIVSHGVLLWEYLEADHFDHLNITTSLSTVALLLAALTLIRSRRAGGLLLSRILYLFDAVTAILMVLSPANWGAQLSDTSGLISHIVLSLLAYAVLMLATLDAIHVLYLSCDLKHHRSH